jgi:hypothetical protein
MALYGRTAKLALFYLKEEGLSVFPFEDFWIEPLGGSDA